VTARRPRGRMLRDSFLKGYLKATCFVLRQRRTPRTARSQPPTAQIQRPVTAPNVKRHCGERSEQAGKRAAGRVIPGIAGGLDFMQ
jgi:hypothetical protein